MNPTYTKVPVDFLNRGDYSKDKKELTDAEWAIQQKKNIKDQKKREKKAKRENAKRQAKEDKEQAKRYDVDRKEREEHTCPTCGHDDRLDHEDPWDDGDPYDDDDRE